MLNYLEQTPMYNAANFMIPTQSVNQQAFNSNGHLFLEDQRVPLPVRLEHRRRAFA